MTEKQKALLNRLLQAFSYPLIIVCGLLVYRAYEISNGRLPGTPRDITIAIVGAIPAGIIGLMGVAARHRPRNGIDE